jgi:diaminopimelate decarboxylase
MEMSRCYNNTASAAAVGDENDVGDLLLEPGVSLRVEEPFYVCDLGIVVAQFYQWKRLLPRVKPYYAMKCNPDEAIVRTLMTLGADFDCDASD